MLHAVSTYVRVHAKSSPLIFGAPFLSLSLACLSPRNLLSTSFALASFAAAAYLLAVSASLFTHSRQEGGFIFGFQQARRRKKFASLSLISLAAKSEWKLSEETSEENAREELREREKASFSLCLSLEGQKRRILRSSKKQRLAKNRAKKVTAIST